MLLYKLVPRPIPLELMPPKLPIAFWHRSVNRTAMPKAAVDEHGKLGSRKDKIWTPEHAHAPAPARDTKLTKDLNETYLGRGVPTAFYAGHDAGTLLL